MASNSEEFSLAVDKIIERTKGKINKIVRKIALDMSSRVIMLTPVDTGRARANWMVGIGTSKQGETVDATDKKGNSTITKVMGDLSDYDYEKDDSIFITNSVPYIGPLEHGHSSQAPNGMVKVTVAEFKDFVEKASKSR